MSQPSLPIATRSWDVAIVGGGISGTMAALELRRLGLTVVILDKDTLGYEASSRNMGAIGALGKFAPELAVPSADAWDELHDRLGVDIELKRAGRLVAAYGAADMPRLAAMFERLGGSGARLERLDGDAARRRFPELGPRLEAALFSPDDGTVNPVKVMAAVSALVRASGVDVLEGVRVGRIAVEGGRVVGLETERGQIVARNVICAAGIWTDSLLEGVGLKAPIQLITVLHAQTQRLPRMFDYFLRTPTCAMRQFESGEVRVSGGYRLTQVAHPLSPRDLRHLAIWVPRLASKWRDVDFTLDGRLAGAELGRFFGSGRYPPKAFGVRIPLALAMRNIHQARKTVPGMEDAEYAETKGGLVDATPDALPIVGPVRDVEGLFVAGGFTGQGFGVGPVVGRVLAECVTGMPVSVKLDRLRLERFREGNLAPFPGIG